MKLHVLLDAKLTLNTTVQDIVLVNNNVGRVGGDGIIRMVNYGLINENELLYKQINEWYNSIGSKGQIDNSAFDAFFRHIFAILYTMDAIKSEYNIDEIWLYDGSRHTYFTSIHAEGEGEKIQYETNWLVNGIIERKYAKEVCVKWVGKKPSIVFYFHHWLRYYKGLFIMLASAVRREKTSNGWCPTDRVTYLSIVDLPLQYRHLNSLFLSTESKHCVFFTLNPLLAKDEQDVHFIPKLNLFQVILVYVRSRWAFRRVRIPILNYKSSILAKELGYLNIQYHLRYERQIEYLKRLIIKGSFVVVTDMTLGMDIVSCHEMAKHLNCPHVNLQYVTMAKVLYPNLELADKFYMYSRRTFELYSKYSGSYRYYLPLKNNPMRIKSRDRNLVFTIFMQPDSFASDYFEYLSAFLPLLAGSLQNVEVIIKPHYRQNRMGELYELVKPYSFVKIAGLHDSCEDLLMNITDIALSIHSSVVFEALLNDVMCLVYSSGGKYDDEIYNNDICYPEVNFVISEAGETLNYFENYIKYKELYRERRKSFIKDNDCNLSLNEII